MTTNNGIMPGSTQKALETYYEGLVAQDPSEENERNLASQRIARQAMEAVRESRGSKRSLTESTKSIVYQESQGRRFEFILLPNGDLTLKIYASDQLITTLPQTAIQFAQKTELPRPLDGLSAVQKGNLLEAITRNDATVVAEDGAETSIPAETKGFFHEVNSVVIKTPFRIA